MPMDSTYYARALHQLCDKLDIERKNVVVVSADNTAVMPSAITAAGFVHAPCVAHAINLMLRGIVETFGLEDLLGWRQYLANSTKRKHEMRKDGLSAAAIDVPAHRFQYFMGFLEAFSNDWDKYGDHIRAQKKENPLPAYYPVSDARAPCNQCAP